jgi:camphor 5-monooxygenase
MDGSISQTAHERENLSRSCPVETGSAHLRFPSPPTIPPHVPPQCVVDIDVYHMPGAERDFLAPWKELQDSSPTGLFWTPRNGGHWIVTRGREISRIYADHENFSSRIVMVPREVCEQFQLRPTTLDPPEHRPYRRLMGAALSPTVVESSQPKIREIIISLIERFRLCGRCEFISEFAELLPIAVFMHLANLPAVDSTTLPRCAEELIHSDGTRSETPIIETFANYLRPYVVERQKQPGDDLISKLVAGTLDGRPLTEDEAVDVSTAMMTGGLDTVTSSLGLMMVFIARNHDHRRRLIEEPSLARPAVAEMLRRFPVMTKARLLRHDQEIEGVVLKAGDVVTLPPLQGLDEREFDSPLEVDFDRRRAPHTTFGNGVHRCPGATLTHAELEITLQEWLARIPEFEIDPLQQPVTQGGVLGAVLRLGLQWNPTSTKTIT